ncbi:hypothetical protein SLEP1_g47986 [Rubroshorea leprosula]|uniref:RNase H type-1 domain-containing protein n=1 Tax=Rubroshorea leprosula TaxID=152421 RepID=A0AAV5LV18_9ROSI|nr:hypothetical protein SLEP1_g47986 [Rubroshorea leprosula]
MTQKAIKGQVIANHLAENTVEDYQLVDWEFLDEDIMAIEESNCETSNWKMHFDGVVNQNGSGVGVVLVSPKGEHFPFEVKLDFSYTNNITEYEACILGLQVAGDMNIRDLEVCGDSSLIIFQIKGKWKTKDMKLLHYY